MKQENENGWFSSVGAVYDRLNECWWNISWNNKIKTMGIEIN